MFKLNTRNKKILIGSTVFALTIGAGIGAVYAHNKAKIRAASEPRKIAEQENLQPIKKEPITEKTNVDEEIKNSKPIVKSAEIKAVKETKKDEKPCPKGYEVRQEKNWQGKHLGWKPCPSDETPKSEPSRESKPSSPTTPSTNNPQQTLMLDLINQARAAQGLGKVTISNALNSAALNKAKDMQSQNYFSHTNPQGKTDFQFMKEAGYQYSNAASNIAKGDFGGDKAVFEGWMNSPGHKANILLSPVTEIGYAKAGNYFVLFLGKPLR